MIDEQTLADLASQLKRRGGTSAFTFKAGPDNVRELAYCHLDRCFFVKVNGRERLRSDTIEVFLPFLCDLSPP